MTSVVVPIEEGRNPAWAIEYVMGLYDKSLICIHLLNVRNPLPHYVARFIPRACRSHGGRPGARRAATG